MSPYEGAQDGKHYWLTPPDLMERLDNEFHFDFDPCPYPQPEDFDGLTAEWGQSNYVNPPFKGPTAWVRKAIEENKKGKRVVFVFPIDKWVHMLLEAGAEVRNLRDVKWCAIEDGEPGKGTGRWIAAFVLEPNEEAMMAKRVEGGPMTPTPETPDELQNIATELGVHSNLWVADLVYRIDACVAKWKDEQLFKDEADCMLDAAKEHIDGLESKLAASEQARQRAEGAIRKSLQHLDVSICECGFHLKETDAADVLRAAFAPGETKAGARTDDVYASPESFAAMLARTAWQDRRDETKA